MCGEVVAQAFQFRSTIIYTFTNYRYNNHLVRYMFQFIPENINNYVDPKLLIYSLTLTHLSLVG